MIQYKYVAINLQKEKFTGIFIAENENDLAIQLQKQGLYLISCKNYEGKVKASFFSLSVGGKVTMTEINTFCRQFAIMINSGISIVGSLDLLKDQKYSSLFQEILAIIADDVKGGMMFSQALEKHKKIFPKFFRSMIVVGEKSGKMDIVLNSLADYYEHDEATKKRIKGAFAYPIMLSIMTLAICVLMIVFVVPKFRESLSSLNVEPEGITKAVYDISDFALEYWKTILVSLVSVIALIFLISRTESGRAFFDKMKVTLPYIKDITIGIYTARFARSFGLLLSSGMDIIDALEASIIVFDNKDVEKRFKESIEDVKHGITISNTFSKNKLFPPIFIQMIAVGEKTNSLDDVLNRSCNFFDQRVDSEISSITSKIQPIMLCIMGGVVGMIFIAIYSPMIDIMNGYGG